MKLKLIAAIGKNNELGNKNDLPLWRLSTDQKRFKNLTEGSLVVMGRKTYESFPEKFRPLPNRRNIVLTRDRNWQMPGAESFESLEKFIQSLDPTLDNNQKEIWLIGGGEIYKQFIDKVDELHITHVDADFEADTFFPAIDTNIWQKVSEEFVAADEKNSHSSTYTIYAKRT